LLRALIPVLGVLLSSTPAPADTFKVDGLSADVYGQPRVGRIFDFHLLAGSRASDEGSDFIPRLVATGWQVIVTDEPYDQALPNQDVALRRAFLADRTAGLTYRRRWARATHQLIKAADERYGTPQRLLTEGVSWGGFNALLAACTNPQVDGYVTVVPAVDPNGLPEWADVPLGNLKLWDCASRLRRLRGFVAWGNQDVRVGTEGVRRLLPMLGASVTACEYPMPHGEPRVTVLGMLRWIRGERGCLPWR
jgi:pimeloyl-ACP methyl ester carboxylesterase